MSAFEVRPARDGDGDGVAGAWRDSAEFYREPAPEAFQVLSVPFHENGMGYERHAVVFAKSLS
ncbi:hypothetical protein [Streptosporangium saharense]|uniref:hypothetical protein n=1 Tax=Streptosporangium saharense TaxID=1706840 RepID=UPI003319E056